MPLTRVEIEQIGPGRWVAEVEAGGTSAVRRGVRATSFDEIILAVVEAHAELTAPPEVRARPVASVVAEAPRPHIDQHGPDGDKPLPADYGTPYDSRLSTGATTSERAAAESGALAAEVAALPERNALREEAAALGIDVDGRWHAERLRAEIERAKGLAGSSVA